MLSSKNISRACVFAVSAVSAVLAAASGLASAATGDAAPIILPVKPVLTLQAARAVASAAERDILQRHLAGSIVVVDDGGHTVLSERMDGATLVSINLASQKANTAAMFDGTSEKYDKTIRSGNDSLITAGMTMLAGGVPLIVNGTEIGAIGISTPVGADDAPIAQAAADILSAAK